MSNNPFKSLLVVSCLLIAACGQNSYQSDVSRQASAKPWTNLEFKNDSADFQFAIVGDRTGGARLGVFDKAVDQINLLQPEFVISVGDFIEGYNEDKLELGAQWDHFDGMVKKLDMPFFYVIGNHDMGNSTMRQFWAERRGPEYYHFIYKDVLFLALNTEDPPHPLSH